MEMTTKLEQLLATRVRINFRYRVNLSPGTDYVKLKEIDEWCRTHCKGPWQSNDKFAVYYQFEDERDATLFTLKWK